MDPITASLLKEAGTALGPRMPMQPIPFTPDELAADQADMRSAASIAELQGQMQQYRNDPVRSQILQSELAKAQAPSASAAPDPITAALLNEASGKVAAPTSTPSSKPQELPDPFTLQRGGSEAAATGLSSLGANIVGGYHGIYKIMEGLKNGKPFGQAMNDAANAVTGDVQGMTYQPKTQAGQALVGAAQSPANPFNWLGMAAQKAGDVANQAALNAGASPEIAAGTGSATVTALNAAPFGLLRGKAAAVPRETPPAVPPVNPDVPALLQPRPGAGPLPQPAPAAPLPSAAARATIPEPASIAVPAGPLTAIEAAPTAGGVPAAVQPQRAAVLQRIGLDKAWRSAVTGDVMEGAVNAQIAKFLDQPAGIAAKEQFLAERQALESHAQKIVEGTGGTVGLDEDAMHARGQTIAAPFDALREWFDKSTTALYKEAERRSGGLPVVSTEPIDALLNDRAFKNSVMAQDKTHLLNAVQDQLELFKENNPQGLTVANAEQFRQWLNQQWRNDNKAILGRIKDSVDNAVMQSAGEDVNSQARAMHQLKMQTLEDPKGINRLMDVDPNTPLNRTTPFEKIPDALTRLGLDQYRNVLKTLREMPADIQPQAQAAIAEIKAHLANKLADIGGKFKGPWNNTGVNDFLAKNSAKMGEAFTDPQEIHRINDLRAAGNILAVDASYPGAAAQAALAAKQGLLSRLIVPAATSAGGAAGSIFGTPGAAAGAWMGRAAGERAAASVGEAAATKKVGKRMIPLNEIRP